MSELKDIMLNDVSLYCTKWEPYFEVYETYFNKFRNKPITMVEVGVYGGGSLQMWRKYFGPDAELIGVDIDRRCMNHTKHYEPNTTVAILDQANPNDWDSFLEEVTEMDIILDDGGHRGYQQITTFEKLFPNLKEGGVYVCEDTHTSYWNEWNTYERSFIHYSKQLADYLHMRHDKENKINFDPKLVDIVKGIKSVAFYDSMVIITKEKDNGFEPVVVNELIWS